MLAATRDAFAPRARLAVETDASVARALERAVAREHHDLLVVGSSRHATEGHVRIGKRTRQLIGHAGCALAVRRVASTIAHRARSLASASATTGLPSRRQRSGLPDRSPRLPAQHCACVASSTTEVCPRSTGRLWVARPRPMNGTSTSEPMWSCSGRRPLRRPGRWTRTPRSRFGVAGPRMRRSSCAARRRPDRDRIPTLGTGRPPAARQHGRSADARGDLSDPGRSATERLTAQPGGRLKGPGHSGLHAASLPRGQAARAAAGLHHRESTAHGCKSSRSSPAGRRLNPARARPVAKPYAGGS